MSENNKSTYTPARAKSQKKYLTKNFDDIKMEYLIEFEKLNDKK